MVGEGSGRTETSASALRTQLQSLEKERDAWAQQRALQTERCAWIERRQQQKARLAALGEAETPTPTPSLPPAPAPDVDGSHAGTLNSATAVNAAVVRTAKSSKREEMHELREKALQLLKTQQQVASKMTSQLRTMAQDPRRDLNGGGNHSNGSSTTTSHSRSPSPPQEKPPSAVTPTTATRRSNKLVLVATTTTALGKRQLVPGANVVPVVQYPALTRATEVPSDTAEVLASAAFRVATRHYLQTGETISRAALRASMDAYVGHSLREDETCAIVEAPGSAMQLLVRGAEVQTHADSPSLQKPRSVVLGDTNVHAWIDAEKSAVHELVSSWSAVSPSEPRSTQLMGMLYAHKFTHDMLGSGPSSSATVEALLSGLLGISHTEDAAGVVETAFPHMTSLFQDAQTWLEGAVAAKETQNTAVAGSAGASSRTELRFDRPFDLERESVMKQVHPKSHKRQRADPMKVMCMYELSGACNDANCAFQHQRDYDAAEEAGEHSGPSAPLDPANDGHEKHGMTLPPASRALMNQFVQLRDNVLSRWPSLSEILNSKQTVRFPPVERVSEANSTKACDARREGGPVEEDGAASKAWDEDFVELGSPLSSPGEEEPPTSAPLRYCQDENVQDAAVASRYSVSSLEDYLSQNPEDIDAWCLLALRWLQLQLSGSDENVVRVSESERLRGELEALHGLLQGPPHVSPSEDKIEQALHVLSRALEIEANAYCEELWLLHLRLSQLLGDKRDIEGELQMTEQALGFVRTSVALWRHFLTLQAACLDKLDDGVATYCALLETIAAASKQAKRRQVKDAFSVLLCDLVIQLCSIYCDAGRPTDASTFLWSLLEGSPGDATADHEDDAMNGEAGEWRQEVQHQMIGDDILILYVLHVHVSLFASVPLWLCDRAFVVSEAVNVYQLLLSPDAVRLGATDGREALRICEAALRTFGDAELIPPGIEVLRHNMIIVSAASTHVPKSERLEQLVVFVDEELQRKTLLPRVVTVLATLARDTFHKPALHAQLVEEVMARYKTVASTLPVNQVYQRFGEALHHYLHHRHDLFTGDPFRTEFPTLKFMLARLSAILPEKKPVYAKRAIKAILGDANWTVQREALLKLFKALVQDTLDHIVKCQLGEGGRDDSDEQDITQDTYYLVAQVQLLGQVCGPRAAVDALDVVVIQGGAAQWLVLPRECRRIVWSTRFTLQLDVLRHEENEQSPSRELLPLLDRYLADVGPCGDATGRAITQQLTTRLAIMADESSAMPKLASAVALCVDYADARPSSALDMAFFRLCLASTPRHERPNLFAMYQHRLGMSSRFWLSYAHTALQDSDRRRVRSGLRRLVLEGSSRVLDAAALRLLVSLELQDKNVQAAALALGHRLRANPLDSTAWGLVGSLEVLFGGDHRARINEIATKLAEAGALRLHTRSILGDGLSPIKVPATTPASVSKLSHATFAGLRLEHVPSAMVMQLSDSLRVLDLSHNALVALPSAVCRLAKLRVLKLSGNSLVTLPPSIGRLTKLHVLELAHNNLSTIPNALWDGLVALQEIDVRCNALTGISPRVVLLTNLQVLRVAGNMVAWKDLEPISSKLPAACTVDIEPAGARMGSSNKKADVGDVHVLGEGQSSKLPVRQASPPTPQAEDEEDMSVLPDTANAGNETLLQSGQEEAISSQTEHERGAKAMEMDDDDADQSIKATEKAIEIDDEEDESKTDASPTRDSHGDGESDDVSVVDVEMTDTSDSATLSAPASPPLPPPPAVQSPPTASPPRDDQVDDDDDDDDDDVECLGSSMSVVLPDCSSSSSRGATPRAELALATETPHQTTSPISEDMRRRLAAEIEWNSNYVRCGVCAAPNTSGTHQRFNVSILCVACIVLATDLLREGRSGGNRPL